MKFSVIVPVYNVSTYLCECLDSLLRQTCCDWEAICVDDGSTDGCSVILDEYSEKDSRIKVIHQTNQGVGATRNRGLEEVSGEWVAFLDADDVYSPWTLEVLNNSILKHPDADIHSFGMSRFDENEMIEWPQPISVQYSQLNLKVNVERSAPTAFFSGKIYSRRILTTIRFPGLLVGEDLVFIFRTMEAASLQINLDVVLYGYRQRESSAMHQGVSERRIASQITYPFLVLMIIEESVKKYHKDLIRQYANAEVELVADSILKLRKDAFRRQLKLWFGILRKARKLTKASSFQRARMMVLTAFHCRFIIWLFGALPYRLKRAGIHRWNGFA